MKSGSPLKAACPNCGTELSSEAQFCFKCGNRIGEAAKAVHHQRDFQTRLMGRPFQPVARIL
jgi:tRNA(Ile2) C34 agmatinyltransferase TiaS